MCVTYRLRDWVVSVDYLYLTNIIYSLRNRRLKPKNSYDTFHAREDVSGDKGIRGGARKRYQGRWHANRKNLKGKDDQLITIILSFICLRAWPCPPAGLPYSLRFPASPAAHRRYLSCLGRGSPPALAPRTRPASSLGPPTLYRRARGRGGTVRSRDPSTTAKGEPDPAPFLPCRDAEALDMTLKPSHLRRERRSLT